MIFCGQTCLYLQDVEIINNFVEAKVRNSDLNKWKNLIINKNFVQLSY